MRRKLFITVAGFIFVLAITLFIKNKSYSYNDFMQEQLSSLENINSVYIAHHDDSYLALEKIFFKEIQIDDQEIIEQVFFPTNEIEMKKISGDEINDLYHVIVETKSSDTFIFWIGDEGFRHASNGFTLDMSTIHKILNKLPYENPK